MKSDNKFKKDFKGKEFELIYEEPFYPSPLKLSWKEFKEAFGKMKDKNNMNKDKITDNKMQLMLGGEPIPYLETLPDSIDLDYDHEDWTKYPLENYEFTCEVVDNNLDLLEYLMGEEVKDYTYTIECKGINIPALEKLQALIIEIANIGKDGEAIKMSYYDFVMLAKGHCIFKFKNLTMEWKDINENKPIDGARVLVCDTYYKRVTIAIYNENNESWDNEEEDISYKLSRCPYWTELPKFKDINS